MRADATDYATKETKKYRTIKFTGRHQVTIDGVSPQTKSTGIGYPPFHPHGEMLHTISNEGFFVNCVMERYPNGEYVQPFPMRSDVPDYDPAKELNGGFYIWPVTGIPCFNESLLAAIESAREDGYNPADRLPPSIVAALVKANPEDPFREHGISKGAIQQNQPWSWGGGIWAIVSLLAIFLGFWFFKNIKKR